MDRSSIGHIYLKLENGAIQKYEVLDLYKDNSGELFAKIKKLGASRLSLEYNVKASELQNRNIFRPLVEKSVKAASDAPKALRFDPPPEQET